MDTQSFLNPFQYSISIISLFIIFIVLIVLLFNYMNYSVTLLKLVSTASISVTNSLFPKVALRRVSSMTEMSSRTRSRIDELLTSFLWMDNPTTIFFLTVALIVKLALDHFLALLC